MSGVRTRRLRNMCSMTQAIVNEENTKSSVDKARLKWNSISRYSFVVSESMVPLERSQKNIKKFASRFTVYTTLIFQEKSAKTEPFRPDAFTVIDGRFTPQIYRYLFPMHPQDCISNTTTQEITRALSTRLGKQYRYPPLT